MRSCSVIVPTRNRAESLRATLESLLDMAVPPDARREIVVVDNNSGDHTRRVVAEMAEEAAAPVRYVFEPRQGKGFALNTGIEQSAGEYLLFTDDDVRVDREWLCEILWTFRACGGDCVGGPIRLSPKVELPDWFPRELLGIVGILDLGPTVFRLGPSQDLFGANLALRRSLCQRVGGFPTDMGPGARFRVGGDTAMFQRVLAVGAVAVYNPRAGVEHRFQPERLRKAYCRRWMFHEGEARALGLPPDIRRLRGIPLFAVRAAVSDARRLVAAVVRGDGQAAFYRETRLFQAAGIVWGSRGPAGGQTGTPVPVESSRGTAYRP